MTDRPILPCLAFSEVDEHAGGPQAVTVELFARPPFHVQRAVSPSAALHLS